MATVLMNSQLLGYLHRQGWIHGAPLYPLELMAVEGCRREEVIVFSDVATGELVMLLPTGVTLLNPYGPQNKNKKT